MKRLSLDGSVKDVRADHVYRYEWAAERLLGHVIDAGCNCGYGAAILADSGLSVTAVDIWADGIDFAKRHWGRPGITWDIQNLMGLGLWLPPCNAVVAFEVIEHLADPAIFLREARRVAPVLLASVPNQSVWPWEPRLAPVHHRHYTKPEFGDLLAGLGWTVSQWWGQEVGYSPVEPDVNGRTLIVECR